MAFLSKILFKPNKVLEILPFVCFFVSLKAQCDTFKRIWWLEIE